jgi:hypothetical protein
MRCVCGGKENKRTSTHTHIHPLTPTKVSVRKSEGSVIASTFYTGVIIEGGDTCGSAVHGEYSPQSVRGRLTSREGMVVTGKAASTMPTKLDDT